jgi:hypothetical protein
MHLYSRFSNKQDGCYPLVGFSNEKFGDFHSRAGKKPARRPVEEEIKRAEKEKADQKANW